MASRKALLIAAATMAVVVVGALLPVTALAENYLVGDDSGGDLDVDYDDWATGKSFKAGDTVEFMYSKDSHNVVLVDDEGSYEACAMPTIARTMTSADDTVEREAAGHYLLVCSFEDHCESGMKLSINAQ